MGIGLALLGISSSTSFAAVIGAFNGYILVFLITWVQSRPPEEFLGRLMSLLLFACTGLIPISIAFSGILSRVDVTGLLADAFGISTAITAIGALTFVSAVIVTTVMHEMV